MAYLSFKHLPSLGGMLAIVFLSILLSWKYRNGSQVATKRNYWWAPLIVAAISMGLLSYSYYALNQPVHLVFTVSLLLLSVATLIVYRQT